MAGNTNKTAAEARNAYYRAYRARNKEKIREINRRYWERKGATAIPENGENNSDERKDT